MFDVLFIALHQGVYVTLQALTATESVSSAKTAFYLLAIHLKLVAVAVNTFFKYFLSSVAAFAAKAFAFIVIIAHLINFTY